MGGKRNHKNKNQNNAKLKVIYFVLTVGLQNLQYALLGPSH